MASDLDVVGQTARIAYTAVVAYFYSGPRAEICFAVYSGDLAAFLEYMSYAEYAESIPHPSSERRV